MPVNKMERNILWIIALACFGVIEGAPNQGIVIAQWSNAGLWKIEGPPPVESTSINGNLYNLSPPSLRITSMDSDYSNNTLFMADGSTGEIYKISNFEFGSDDPLNISTVHKGLSQSLIHIAFDVVTKNLYWTDSYYNWIAMKPAYSQDSTDYKVIIEHNLQEPHGLTIDSYDGYMFFVELWNNTRIERATLAGQERRTIVHTGLLRIFSMTVDHFSKTLYWVDYSKNTIESSDYDGNNRDIIVNINGRLWTSVDFHGGYLFAVSYFPSMLYIVDAVNKTVAKSVTITSVGDLFAVHYFDNETFVDFNNTCQYKGCSDICVHTPSGPKCLCKEGSVLQNDSITCSAPTGFYGKGILFSNQSAVCMLEIQSITGFNNFTVPCINIPEANITSIAADVSSHVVFYLDSNNNSLVEYNIISEQYTYLTSVDDASYLVYDWIDGILLWIEESSREIKAYTRTTQYVTTLYTSAVPISHLTADSHSRKLFWLSGNAGNESIMVGDFHGGNSSELFSPMELYEPSLLYFDITSHRLFWINYFQVTSALSDGTSVQHHSWIHSNSTHFLIYKDFAVWIKNGVFYADTDIPWYTGTTDHDILQGYGVISSLFVYDILVQKPEAGPCDILNGGCEEICLPGDGIPICKCDIGLQLQADNKTCASDSEPLQSDFLLVTDFHHGRALQLSLTNGSMMNTGVKMYNPTASTFDKTRNEFLWFENFPDFIYSHNIYGDESSTPPVPIYGATIVGMDIDYSTGNIYFIAHDFIGVVHRLSSEYKTLISPYDETGDISLYPSKGLMFSTEYGIYGPIVSRAKMDGTGYEELFNTYLLRPMGLAIDYSADLLYWVDNGLNTIDYCNLDGSNRQTINTAPVWQPAYLTIYGDYLYYTAWTSRQVLKVNKITGERLDFMSDNPELGRLDGITAVPGESQPIHSICAQRNGNCSTLCLPTSPTSRVCACEDFVDLLNGTVCSNVNQCPLQIPNGEMHSDCLRYPLETCNYTCNLGYLKNTSIESLDCSLDGEWKQNISTENLTSLCIAGPPTTTPEPPTTTTPVLLCTDSISNGTLSKTCTREVNTVCPFTCFPGYPAKDGLTSLTCNSQGSWNHDTNNICQPLICPNVVTNGAFRKSCSRFPDTTCLFECDSGYVSTIGMVALRCGFQGSWDKDINTLCKENLCNNTVANGRLLSTCTRMPETSCPLQCDLGFRPQMGITSLLCDNGQWNYDVNTICQPLKCLHNVSNGQLEASCPRDANTTCSLNCDNRYRPVDGVTSLTCGFDGNWSKNISTVCKEIDCGNVTKPVLLSPGCATVVGSQCSYQCAKGYKRNASMNSLTCQNTGDWSSNSADLCKEITCPAKIPNSEAILSGCSKKFQAKCNYYCSNGYTKNPKLSFLTCLESGNWDNPMYPLCEAIKPAPQEGNEAVSIVGIAAAALFLLVIIIVVGVVCLRRQHRDQQFQRQRIASLSEEKGTSVYSEVGSDRDRSYKGFQNPQYENPAFEQKNSDYAAGNDKGDVDFTKM